MLTRAEGLPGRYYYGYSAAEPPATTGGKGGTVAGSNGSVAPDVARGAPYVA